MQHGPSPRRSDGCGRAGGRFASGMRWAAVGLAWLGSVTWPGSASAYDPTLVWRTVSTEHFEIHYPEGIDDNAADVAQAAETAYTQLTDRLGWLPAGPIHIVLNDDTDAANGSAQNVPYNLISLNMAAPEEVGDLSDYDDWLYLLVAHELAHIVHIDTILGVPRVLNAVFGRWFAPNGVQPSWLVEGLAVHFESALTSAGRLRSAYFDMILRLAVLDGTVMDLGKMSGVPWEWPQGTVPYLYGGQLVDYLARNYGEDTLREVSYDYGGRLIPYAVNVSVSRATGVDYSTLYADWLARLKARYESQRAEVEAQGRVEGTLLTDRGQEIGPARIGRDGTVYFVEAPIGGHASLKAMTPQRQTREVAWVQAGSSLALTPDGTAAVVAQLETHATYRLYSDLFRVELASGAVEQLTHGARAASPDISADGQSLVYVRNEAGHTMLCAAPVAELTSPIVIADLGPDTQIFSPRFSPDGTRVVFSGHVGGQRDLFSVSSAGGDVTRLTDDRAFEGGPVFAPDGSSILFHSDRDGIFNLYAMPAQGGQVRRITRVLGGAFYPEPTPDGGAVIYRAYGPRGFDLAELALPEPEDDPGTEPDPPTRPKPVHRPAADSYSSRSYRPWSSLAPRAWLPVLGADARGDTLGLAVTGQDAVGQHQYGVQAWWGLTSQSPGFIAVYANRQFHPGLSLFVRRGLGFAPVSYVRNGRGHSVEEEVWSGQLATTWPLWLRRDRRVLLSTAYELSLRRATQPFFFDPLDTAPTFPDEGRFAALRLDLSLSNAHRYLGSISAEDGGELDLGLRVEAPYLGSQYRAVSGTVDVLYYVKNPWLARHVLAAHAFAGYGESSYERRRLFAIGGLYESDVLLDLLLLRFSSGHALRGFPARPFAGNAIVSGSVEYRFPLMDLETGVVTLPLYFRTLHAAVFADGAAIADQPAELASGQHYSVGGELRLGLLLGYAVPVTLRLGFGYGLGRDRVHSTFLVVGSTF